MSKMRQNISLFLLLLFLFSPHVKEGNPGASWRQINPVVGLGLGNQAPEISLKNFNDSLIPLSSLKGKVVLLDFWASWCGPCRIENRNLVRIYGEFKDKEFTKGKGFAIYSVSLDTDKESWKKAIEKDGLQWPYHVSDLKMWSGEAVAKYRIDAIPHNMLLNEHGVIIEKNLTGKKLESALKKMLVLK